MRKVSEIMKSVDFILRYGGTPNCINKIKKEISELNNDEKLFILNKIPSSIQFMNENL